MSKQENTKLIQKIVDIYKKLLLRDPDRRGLLHWIKKITDNEITIEELEQLIKSSPEFQLCNEFKQGFIHTSQGFDLWINPNDNYLSRHIAYEKVWEPETTSLVKNILKTNDCAIDIGSNIGYFTILFSTIVGNSGKVFSYEPEPNNFNLLQKNIKTNNAKNVIAKPFGVGSISSTGTLYISKKNSGDHRFFPNIMFDSDIHRNNIQVKLEKLDDVINSEKIDLIKIDTQGFELNVLEGAKKIIKNNNQLKLIIEFYPMGLRANNVNPEQLLNFLINNGFYIFSIDENYQFVNYSVERFCELHKSHSAPNLYCERPPHY